jgi:branched-chain amino acid transport system substrate-binding protein
MKKFLLAVAAAVLLSLPTAALADGHTVKIAVVGPLTGDLASFGEQMERGAHAAVADLNAAGGVNGKEVELVEGDDRCDPKEAVAVANKMVNDNVVFVAGHFCSSASIPASEVYWDNDVLQISPASTNPTLTENGYANVFRTCGRDDQQGDVAGTWLAKHFKGKKVAFIHDKTAYGKGLADFTKANFEAAGGTSDLYESINAGEQDYSALVTKLKSRGVEALYFGGYHAELGLIARQSADQNYKPVFLSGDAQNTLELWSITGDSGEGILFTFAPDPRSNPDAASLVERFRSEGYEPEGYTLYTYAAIQVWAESARKAGSFDTGAVSDAMRGGNFSTVIGPLSFDSKGDRTTADYTWYKWTEGNYAEVGIDYKP